MNLPLENNNKKQFYTYMETSSNQVTVGLISLSLNNNKDMNPANA
jgi:hypothetical protein